MVDMKYSDIRERMHSLIIDYIDDEILQSQLLEKINTENGIRGVLYALDENKTRKFSEEDENFCKDLFFYFG
ncbi:hypothetical protein AB1I63_00915 [Streptococcus pneumoniae]